MSPAARQLKQEQAERKATESITARVREFETHLCRELRSTRLPHPFAGEKIRGRPPKIRCVNPHGKGPLAAAATFVTTDIALEVA